MKKNFHNPAIKNATQFNNNTFINKNQTKNYPKKLIEIAAGTHQHRFYPKSRDLKPEPTPKMRNQVYIREAERLSLEAVKRLLSKTPDS